MSCHVKIGERTVRQIRADPCSQPKSISGWLDNMYVMRCFAYALAACSAFTLSACSFEPQVKACETFVREKISTPSTLKVVSTSYVPGSAKGIRGLDPAGEVMLVSVEYDSENEYGASVRSTAHCAFPMKQGQLPSLTDMERRASSSASSAKLNAIRRHDAEPEPTNTIRRINTDEEQESVYDCCIP